MAVDLFTKDELEAYLQRRHDAEPPEGDGVEDDPSTGIEGATFDVVHRLVRTWLADAIQVDELETTSDRLWSWGIELAALAVENPASTSAMTTDRVSKTWSAADARRRDQILARAREWAWERGEQPLSPPPVGSFPTVPTLPSDLAAACHGYVPMRSRWSSW